MEMRMTTDLETALPAEIGFNFDELKTELTARLDHYNTLVVTEDAIKEAKTDLANLRKLRDAIDTKRKEVKKKCMEPYTVFEAQVKELTALIDAPVTAINEQLKAFEDRSKEEKLEEITKAYEEIVPAETREIIPLERILDPKWLNKGTTMKSIRENLAMIATRTKIDILYLESTIQEEYITAVRAKYIETLSVEDSMHHRDALVAAQRAFRQREAAAATAKPQTEERPPVAAQEPVREQEETVYLLRLELQLSKTQASALKDFLVRNNINHRKI